MLERNFAVLSREALSRFLISINIGEIIAPSLGQFTNISDLSGSILVKKYGIIVIAGLFAFNLSALTICEGWRLSRKLFFNLRSQRKDIGNLSDTEAGQIAKTLDKAQELIDLRKSSIAKLDELAKSIFIDMFGDPVSNPKGWEVKELDDVCEITSSKRVYKSDYVSEGIPFYKIKEIILKSKNNLVSIAGGKWTTYRKMAEDLVDFLIKNRFLEKRKKCETKNINFSALQWITRQNKWWNERKRKNPATEKDPRGSFFLEDMRRLLFRAEGRFAYFPFAKQISGVNLPRRGRRATKWRLGLITTNEVRLSGFNPPLYI